MLAMTKNTKTMARLDMEQPQHPDSCAATAGNNFERDNLSICFATEC